MNDELAAGRHLLTIGQLADYTGVTIKAVRVYHDRGLLPEPPRDSSGYRRYGADHAIQLVKIRTLAEAGVPLARIKELLKATPERFSAALDEIDHNLAQRAERIQLTRQRIAALDHGDRLFVTPEVAEYLDQLRRLGISERSILLERDLWILLQSAAPQEAAAWIADKTSAITDPEFQQLYRDYDAAFDWSPHDPRLPELAERTHHWYGSRQAGEDDGPAPAPAITRLANVAAGASSPAWTRIGELARRTP
ncbi:DNA-binding transcriptional MerR regulator [Hamadaea flava]|uniref:MerR family transcriptional regulator n=1 Tax=Hamadaea flava TaxID=1742688 RepID=A0ABV8LXS8_9ACTN|nr:MerR family transcriptional regulator [Hamadaea flava]MCP2323506.1 DNA-binding transcriptional MerR regulator [Hamadaea flava]